MGGRISEMLYSGVLLYVRHRVKQAKLIGDS